jgi:catalase
VWKHVSRHCTAGDLVDALNGVFGKHAGDRAAHTKGICLTGSFTPSAEAPKLSKAAHFAKEVPIRARFSLGGGNPNAPDNAQDNVRGLAVKFDLGNGVNTDLVTISAPVFNAKTPELFVELLKTVASGDKDKLNAFFAAHPESPGSCRIRCRRAMPGSTISACTPSPSPMRPARGRSSNIT